MPVLLIKSSIFDPGYLSSSSVLIPLCFSIIGEECSWHLRVCLTGFLMPVIEPEMFHVSHGHLPKVLGILFGTIDSDRVQIQERSILELSPIPKVLEFNVASLVIGFCLRMDL